MPHLEKLLINNTKLLIDCTLAYECFRDEELLSAIELIYEFLIGDTKIECGFASSLGADFKGMEGY